MPNTTTPKKKQPQDRKSPQRAQVEAEQQPEAQTTIEYDGEQWTVRHSDATGLEFLAAIEDEEFIPALRMLLGREQAARFFKGRTVDHVADFFDHLGEAVGTGNP